MSLMSCAHATLGAATFIPAGDQGPMDAEDRQPTAPSLRALEVVLSELYKKLDQVPEHSAEREVIGRMIRQMELEIAARKEAD
jgi:hypothetical protein